MIKIINSNTEENTAFEDIFGKDVKIKIIEEKEELEHNNGN